MANHAGEAAQGNGGVGGGLLKPFRPNQRVRVTREGAWYLVFWAVLVGIGLYHQINLILLIAGLAAGPFLASWFGGARMIARPAVMRRLPGRVFVGERLTVNYRVENRGKGDALAVVIHDSLEPVDATIPGATSLPIRLFLPRIADGSIELERWTARGFARGRYRCKSVDIITRHPYGLLERTHTVAAPGDLIAYPGIGRLTRRWRQALHVEASQTRRGRRHDRSTQRQEYHGLRDYRPDDSPRFVHWRTSARLGMLMVREFEQQHDQDLAILLDPWIPKNNVTREQREHIEEMIRFAATVCVETCRSQGRRLLLGWTGAAPGLRQGPASVKLLHGMLEQLAILRPSSHGRFSELLDVLPPAVLRDAVLIAVSSRTVNMQEEAERSGRLSGAGGRGILSRIRILDVSRGDLAEYYDEDPNAAINLSAAKGGLAAPDAEETDDSEPSAGTTGFAPGGPLETDSDASDVERPSVASARARGQKP